MKLLLLLLLALPAFSAAAENRSGYVDTGTVLSSVPRYAALRKRPDTVAGPLQDSLNRLGGQLEALGKKLQGDLHYPVPVRDSLGRALTRLQERIESYQDYAFTKVALERQQVAEQTGRLLLQDMAAFCTARGIPVLLERRALACCPRCVDYTADFIAFLKKEQR
jgi:Skp family chaperone for outer membrane proteins